MSDKRKWTKGPWMMAAKPSSVVGWPIVSQQGRSIANLNYVGFMGDGEGWKEFREESTANGSLIAAAPDLYEALEGMLAEWDKLTRYGSPIAKASNEAVNFARAALAKALPPPPSNTER